MTPGGVDLDEYGVTALEEYRAAMAVLAAAKYDAAEAKAKLLKAMREHDIGLIDGRPAVVISRFTQDRFDTNRFRLANPRLYNEYLRPTAEIAQIRLVAK